MTFRPGKNFIVGTLAALLTIGGLASIIPGSKDAKDVTPVKAQTYDQAGRPVQATENNTTDQSSNYRPGAFEEGYRAGYRDAQQDCTSTAQVAARTYAPAGYTNGGSRRTYTSRRRGVAGRTYYVERRRGHSTRDLILTIAAPAAIGAGVGAIAGGKKGAGVGALLGGGGGALYHLVRNRRRD